MKPEEVKLDAVEVKDYTTEELKAELKRRVELRNAKEERIRNAIIATIHLYYGEPLEDEAKEMIAWLEKQCQQKPILDGILTATNYDKWFQNCNAHKFKVGDFIVNDYCFGKVIEITNDAYLLDTGQGIPFSYEHNAHIWSIKDAKDGDVLVGKIDGDNYILIFKQIKDGWIETYGHYYSAVDRFCVPSQLFCRDYKGTFYPAIKEQRNLLFAKMKEAGYQWDTENKELKKIEQNLASSAKTCKDDTLLDLLHKMPSYITVDGIFYHFMLRKTALAYTAYYAGEEEGGGKVIFWMAGEPIELLTAMLNKLKEEGLLDE